MLTDTSYIRTGELPTGLKLSPDEFSEFWDTHPIERHVIRIFGKDCVTPRWFQVYGVDDYSYSGSTFPTLPVTPFLQKYLDWANESETDKYNMVLVNWYGSGRDYIGWHRDDEKQIIPDSDVMTVSFGGERRFKIKYDPIKKFADKPPPEVKTHEFVTADNSFLVMGWTFQSEYKHHIPSTAKNVQPRISITFRKFK